MLDRGQLLALSCTLLHTPPRSCWGSNISIHRLEVSTRTAFPGLHWRVLFVYRRRIVPCITTDQILQSPSLRSPILFISLAFHAVITA